MKFFRCAGQTGSFSASICTGRSKNHFYRVAFETGIHGIQFKEGEGGVSGILRLNWDACQGVEEEAGQAHE